MGWTHIPYLLTLNRIIKIFYSNKLDVLHETFSQPEKKTYFEQIHLSLLNTHLAGVPWNISAKPGPLTDVIDEEDSCET